MNWLNAQFEQARREDEVRVLAKEAEIEAMLARAYPSKTKNKNVRRALGSKLVELGERLQETQPAPRPSTSKI